MIRKPTGEQIKAYRDKHEVGFYEAKAACLKEWRVENLTVLYMQATVLNQPQIALMGLLSYLLELESDR